MFRGHDMSLMFQSPATPKSLVMELSGFGTQKN